MVILGGHVVKPAHPVLIPAKVPMAVDSSSANATEKEENLYEGPLPLYTGPAVAAFFLESKT